MYKVKAIYEYSSEHDDDLNFPIGQIITVTEEEGSEWFVGEYTDDSGQFHEGMFPSNFVEKYEPVAPPRPTRTRTKRDSEIPVISPGAIPGSPSAPAASFEPSTTTAPVPTPLSPIGAPRHAQEEEEEEADSEHEPEAEKAPQPVKTARPLSSPPAATPSAPTLPPSKPAEPKSPSSPVAAAAPKASEASRPPPPAAPKPSTSPVAENPSGNSFRDRIAAFNKAAAPPITPFKPSGLAVGGGSSTFVKKPFVAPPPSRNAYIPPARDVPTAKIYRRDEDPEIKEREAENLGNAEKAGLVPGSSGAPAASGNGGDGDEEEPKPMTLKERLARLQREQQEQASRHAEAAAKKEKPKRPQKKRLESFESSGAAGGTAAAEEVASSGSTHLPPLERKATGDTAGRRSVEEPAAPHASRTPHAPRRKASRDPGSAEAQDGNDADMSGAGDTTEGQDEDLTERDDSDEKSRRHSRTIPIIVPTGGNERRSVEQSRDVGKDDDEEEEEEEAEASQSNVAKSEDVEQEEGNEDEEEDEADEEDVDPEARRREELRARMAKMSGGMGMMGMQGMQGMFGAPAPPPKKKKASAAERRTSESTEEAASPSQRAPPVPTMMALPGLATRRSEDKSSADTPAGYEEDEEEDEPTPVSKETRSPSLPIRGAPPPVPGNRPVPPPPPPPMADIKSPSEGSISDDELIENPHTDTAETPRGEPSHFAPPPPPPASAPRPPPAIPTSPRASIDNDAGPTSPTTTQNKRASRLPPPIPSSAPAPPPIQTRPPPPPPPGALSRQSTADMRSPLSPTRPNPVGAGSDDENEEVTEYEGDYDTDIANPVPHKNSLKSHARDSSLEDSASLKSPISEKAPSFPPPVPGTSRAPPPVPSQPPPGPAPSLPSSQPPPPPPPPSADKRQSVDVPRGPPPRPPPPGVPSANQPSRHNTEYDPYSYSGQPTSPGMSQPGYPLQQSKSFMDDAYTPPDLSLSLSGASSSTATVTRGGAGSQYPQAPPPPPPQAPVPTLHSSRARQSMDMSGRGVAPGGRRSVDVSRPSMETGFVANDIDLAPHSGWWLQPNGLPPQLQGRKDIFTESEQSQAAKQGRKVEITRDLYILYHDYSQTVVTVRFDPSNASEVHLEQRHEPPPRSPREHQFDEAYGKFGSNIANAVLAKKDTVVGDGTPQSLVLELIKAFPDALLPVGTRAYGALVYANMANASTTLTDSIRPGDIITLRNAKFQGKHGAMHAKYSAEVGKPDHVAIVSEWDGTKKKVRAWEQGRESKKVKLESFKLDDLRSGEVRIWRVMPRKWVGWEDQNDQK